MIAKHRVEILKTQHGESFLKTLGHFEFDSSSTCEEEILELGDVYNRVASFSFFSFFLQHTPLANCRDQRLRC